MGYSESNAGKVQLQGSGSGTFWTYELVEQRLVECMRLWFRSPGGGRWPFARDAPWHLVTPDASDVGRAEYVLNAEAMGDRPATDSLRPLPLTRAEVQERDETSEWMLLVPEKDRHLVVLALEHLASGAKRVPWIELLPAMGKSTGADGLRMRYGRAIAAVAKALNAAERRSGTVSRAGM